VLNIVKVENIINSIRSNAPLIHCITNPISINDCANAVLAVGAKPIMAEHPKEVAKITSMASVLAVNLGNITDARINSIMISGKTSLENNIPSVIDAVGVTCSDIRLELAKEYINVCRPAVIKGNISEIKVLNGLSSDAAGIDVSDKDTFSSDNEVKMKYTGELVKELAKKTNSVVVATGVVDTISDGCEVYYIQNGCEMMSSITGTGCMLNVLIASYISAGKYTDTKILDNAICATALLGIAGERARDYTLKNNAGLGTFHVRLLDEISLINAKTLCENAMISSF
jgi:hydroxyethylthiazole kinase